MERSPRDCCALCGNTEFHPKLTISRRGDYFSIVQCGGCEHVFVADPPADTSQPRRDREDRLGIPAATSPDQAANPRAPQVRSTGTRDRLRAWRGRLPVARRSRSLSGLRAGTRALIFGIRAGVPIIQEIYRGGDTADAIVIDNVIEHVAEPRQMVEVAARSLRPGGLVIVITPMMHARGDFPAVSKRHLWIPPVSHQLLLGAGYRFHFHSSQPAAAATLPVLPTQPKGLSLLPARIFRNAWPIDLRSQRVCDQGLKFL